jgi:ABC-type transporter Mla MlaB component
MVRGGSDRGAAENSSPAPTDEFRARRPSVQLMAASAPQTIDFAITGSIERSDLPGLCDRICAILVLQRPTTAFCNVSGVEPDAVCVDALARLQLAARRHGCTVRLRHASAELLALVAFMGLTDVLAD